MPSNTSISKLIATSESGGVHLDFYKAPDGTVTGSSSITNNRSGNTTVTAPDTGVNLSYSATSVTPIFNAFLLVLLILSMHKLCHTVRQIRR